MSRISDDLKNEIKSELAREKTAHAGKLQNDRLEDEMKKKKCKDILEPLGYKLIYTNGYVYTLIYYEWEISLVYQYSKGWSRFCVTISLHTDNKEDKKILCDKWRYPKYLKKKIESIYKEEDFIVDPADWDCLHSEIIKRIGVKK